ncbi:hypothetical protein [Klebsiella oxytoca]|uniref:hypothetical protein n=1 Tax=Klebsiella oxytoca TaxID=571 RepID=UPI0015E8C802|nr:hypothetical protein [Klebsiella oxytoca]HCB1498210.1 hypothetical protein [Klebsiella michiganensis]HCB1843905.1 hypothetical protein [Klebsiella oxytoca]
MAIFIPYLSPVQAISLADNACPFGPDFQRILTTENSLRMVGFIARRRFACRAYGP